MPSRVKVRQVCPDCGNNLYYSYMFKTFLCRPCNQSVELKEEPKPFRKGLTHYKLRKIASKVLSTVEKYRIVDNILTAREVGTTERTARNWLNRLVSENQLSKGLAYRHGSNIRTIIYVLKGDEQGYNLRSTEDYEVVYFKGMSINFG